MNKTRFNKVLFSDDFQCKGHFDYRTIVEESLERMSNWAVKITGLPDGRLFMAWVSREGNEPLLLHAFDK